MRWMKSTTVGHSLVASSHHYVGGAREPKFQPPPHHKDEREVGSDE